MSTQASIVLPGGPNDPGGQGDPLQADAPAVMGGVCCQFLMYEKRSISHGGGSPIILFAQEDMQARDPPYA